MMLLGKGVLVPGWSMTCRCRGNALQFGGGGQGDARAGGLLPQPLPLFADEEEELVLLDGAGQVVAEIVEAKLA